MTSQGGGLWRVEGVTGRQTGDALGPTPMAAEALPSHLLPLLTSHGWRVPIELGVSPLVPVQIPFYRNPAQGSGVIKAHGKEDPIEDSCAVTASR